MIPNMETFTIDAADTFTAHKAGCAHLMGSNTAFDITPTAPTRDAIYFEVEAAGFEDVGIEFAPCMRSVR